MALNIENRVKRYLNIFESETKYDDILSDLINYASEWIEEYCNQPIEETIVSLHNIQVKYDGLLIHIPYKNIPVSINYFKYKTFFEDSYTDMPAENYQLVYEGTDKFIKVSQSLSQNYVYDIQLVVGYAADSIPQLIQQVATEIIAWKYQESSVGKNLLGITSVADSGNRGSSTTSYKDLNERWKDMLKPFRKIPVYSG